MKAGITQRERPHGRPFPGLGWGAGAAAAVALFGCGRSPDPEPRPELPTCRLEPVGEPRLLYDGRDNIAAVRAVAADDSRVAVLWGSTSIAGPVSTYLVLDRLSGEEIARYTLPYPRGVAAAGDDVVVEWRPLTAIRCTDETDLAIYEDFADSRPFGQGHVAEERYEGGGAEYSMLAIGPTLVLQTGTYGWPMDSPCWSRFYPPGPVMWWYYAHARDGSGSVWPRPDALVGGWQVRDLAESNGRALLLLTASRDLGVVGPDGFEPCCPDGDGTCLFQLSPEGEPERTECLAAGYATELLVGRSTVLAGGPGRLQALRLPEGEPMQVLADFTPSWVGWCSRESPCRRVWTAAGAGFAAVGTREEAGSARIDVLLLDETGAVVQELPFDHLWEYGEYFVSVAPGLAATDRCLDVAWSKADDRDDPDPSTPVTVRLQSFCCAP